MKILVIKTSSLGDILHTFPAIYDAITAIKNLEITWVVEESFIDIVALNKNVKKIIPAAFRRIRKNFFKNTLNGEVKNFFLNIRKEKYDFVIDAQGLIKSAIIAKIARGKKIGFAKNGLREPLARFFYKKHCDINLNEHAIFRMRSIFAFALNYKINKNNINYGIKLNKINKSSIFLNNNLPDSKFIFFAHGTTWPSKKLPEKTWHELAMLFSNKNFKILVAQSNNDELLVAEKIKNNSDSIYILPRLSLYDIAEIIARAILVIAVDTGLAHLASALNIPTISIYGATDPNKTGTIGVNQIHIVAKEKCAPCFKKICPIKKDAAEHSVCLTNINAIEILQIAKFKFML